MGQVGALHYDLLGPGRDRLRTLQRRQLLLPLAPQPPEHGQGEIVATITRNMLSWFLFKNPHPLVWVVDNHNQILVQNITVIRHTLMWDSKVSNVMSSIIN